jgi:tetratricopeptide (TPR) repeat protein
LRLQISEPVQQTSADSVAGTSTLQASRLLSNVQNLRHNLIGRNVVLQRICEELGSVPEKNVLVLHGVPGVGKSELAREVARRLHRRYPGGTFEIDFKLGPALPLAEIGRRNLGLTFAPDLKPADQAQQTVGALFADRTLLIYDNVTDPEVLRSWLPPHGAQCHILITSFLEKWDGWWATEVEPLSAQDSVLLVENLAGREIAGNLGKQLARTAGGLPVELCPAAVALAREYRRWKKLPRLPSNLARESQQSFERAYRLLESDAQLLLQGIAFLESQRAPMKEMVAQLQESLSWDETKVRDLADSCIDMHLLQGGDELRMHQTVASFVVETTLSSHQKGLLAKIRQVQTHRLVDVAEQVAANPAQTDLAAIMMLFPVAPQRWEEQGIKISVGDGEAVGRALANTGRFNEAQPWYERAVKEKEQGDVHGRVDHESLGSSLHQMGYCLFEVGKYAEAQPWFERAVKEKEQGDVLHGRVDHKSLGISLHQIGNCLSRIGKYAEAQPWFERAITEAEQGDPHGRVDHKSLGSSLHQMAYCLSRVGKYAEAQPWYERAVKEAEQGNLHGRVDHESLGTSLLQVGYCLSQVGKYTEAQPWYERAVKETEQGDVHGRLDHASIGISLHQMGYCLFELGKYAEALPWFERAVKEKEQGDVHGRLDHKSIGISLYQMGYCLFEVGKYAEALPWYKRAVEEAEQGDVHGRLDHASIGISLHQMGSCLSRVGKYAEAQPWYERAVKEKEQGDVHGRVDHESLSSSVHAVGSCLSRAGKYAEAQPWYERAAMEAEQGDMHGRVDHASLGRSLQQVGYCLSQAGKYAEAQPWYECAVKETEQGDVHGRLDHETIRVLIQQLVYSLRQLRREDEAAQWESRL